MQQGDGRAGSVGQANLEAGSVHEERAGELDVVESSGEFAALAILYFFALITEGFLISPGYSFELCIKMGISFLFSFAFSFSSFHSYL